MYARKTWITVLSIFAATCLMQAAMNAQNAREPDDMPAAGMPPVGESLKDSVLVNAGYTRIPVRNLSGAVEQLEGAKLNRDRVINPLEAIQGRVPGLSILKSNNGTAALESVRVRGTTSLVSGNDPLIIVDGVFGDLNMLNSIFPADIESFTILKDASETSQYGSRGASGVISIVTRKGQSGKARLSYSGSAGIIHAYRHLDMLSGEEYRKVASEYGLAILDMGYDTDFQEAIEQMGFEQNHNLALYGGSETSSYRVSLGFQDRKGVILNENRRQFTSSMNFSQSMFKGLMDVEIGMFGSVNRGRSISDDLKTFYSASTFNPTFPDTRNPSTGSWDQITTASQITNPLAWMEVDNSSGAAYLSTHAKVSFNVTEALRFILSGSYSFNQTSADQYFPTSVWGGGQAYRETRKTEMLLGNAMVTWTRDIGRHSVDILGMGEIGMDTHSGFHTTVTGFSSDGSGYHNLQGGALRPWEGTASFFDNPRQVSFLGRVNYTYAGRYILTVNARTDASSKFGANHKWGFFPSVSVAWNISEEEFMSGLPYVDFLKLRAGYGLTGNQAGIESYTSLSLLRPGGVSPSGNTPVVTYEALRNMNPDLKWEVKHTANAGFDLGVLGERLLLSVNWYSSRTEDMLYNYSVSVPPFPYSTLLANLGEMENSGTEISLGITPLRTEDMELNINANVSFQKNRLVSLSGEYQGHMVSAAKYTAVAGLDGAGFHGGYNNIVYQIVGQPLGVFYLPHCEGLEPDGEGGYRYRIADLNGGGVNIEDGQDRYIAGQAVPKALLGSNISFRYRQFDVSLQINGAFGHKIYNATYLSYMNMGSFPDYNVLSEAPGMDIRDQTATDYWLEDGDYVNFDYLTVGWTMPVRSGSFLRNLRLAFTVGNLATITGYSGLTPLINSSVVGPTLGVDDKRTYPLSRTWTLSLNVNF